MSWVRKIAKCKEFVIFLATLWMMGCGVKGDPLPPEKPPELGRGRPTYRGATKDIPIQKSQPQDDEDKDKDEEDESEE